MHARSLFAITLLLGGLHGSSARADAPKKACPGALRLGEKPGAAPFRPGEELAYELEVGGLLVGRLEMRVGTPKPGPGAPAEAWPLVARARTTTFSSAFQAVDGRYVAYLDRRGLAPLGARIDGVQGKEPRTEDIEFLDARRGVASAFLYRGFRGRRTYHAREAELFDLLSLLYFARTRELAIGSEACQEVLADRRLWRLDAKITRLTAIETPAGKLPAYEVECSFVRLPHHDFDPRSKPPSLTLTLHLSADDTRTPLRFELRSDIANVRANLVRWQTGPA